MDTPAVAVTVIPTVTCGQTGRQLREAEDILCSPTFYKSLQYLLTMIMNDEVIVGVSSLKRNERWTVHESITSSPPS
jgi:hypothetical protein